MLSPVVLTTTVALWLIPVCLSKSPELIRGHVKARVSSDSPQELMVTFLTSRGKKILVAGDRFSNGQLLDSRLAKREWELEGEFQPNGHFEILKLFTIKQGKRHRVTYWCEICYIRSHEPGRCMCCQEETNLQEIPELSDDFE